MVKMTEREQVSPLDQNNVLTDVTGLKKLNRNIFIVYKS